MNPATWKKLMAALGGTALGTGVSEMENRLVVPGWNDESKHMNLMLGGATGLGTALAPATERAKVIAGWPLKTAILALAAGAGKFTESQQSLMDTKQETAKLDREAAMVNAATAGQQTQALKSFLLPAMLGAGGLAYYAYNQRKKPRKAPARYKNEATKGTRRGTADQRVKIEIPGKSLPPEFFQSLTDVDDNSRAYAAVQKKASAGPPKDPFGEPWYSPKNIAMEWTGIRPGYRALQDTGKAVAHSAAGDFSQAANYGAGAVGNASWAALPAYGAATYAGRKYAPQLANQVATGTGYFGATRPGLGQWLWDHSNNRQARDAARNARYAFDPARYAYKGTTPTVGGAWGEFFRKNLTHRPATTTAQHANNAMRWMGNKGVNLGSRVGRFARRHPIGAMLAGGLALSGYGTTGDEIQRWDDYNMLKSLGGSVTERNGRPISAQLDSLMRLFGGGGSPLASQFS